MWVTGSNQRNQIIQFLFFKMATVDSEQDSEDFSVTAFSVACSRDISERKIAGEEKRCER